MRTFALVLLAAMLALAAAAPAKDELKRELERHFTAPRLRGEADSGESPSG